MISLIKEKLRDYKPKSIQCEQTVMAGVIIPILEMDGTTSIVLTKRTCSVKIHKGEVSFPGGAYEEKDRNTLETALRECCEEIGVRKKDIEIIGRLGDMYTLTGFVITPYVGVVPYPYTFKISPNEVAYLIYLPFEFLLNMTPKMEEATHEGKTERVHSFYYEGDRIWGATCRILLKLREIVNGEKV
jgi:8-oxo-dGTP pyrophosphatase MutT (NUDIX family)